MRSSVKEFFNQQEQEKLKEKKKILSKNKIMCRCHPYSYKTNGNIKNVKPLDHIIDCDKCLTKCPLRFEDLEIDFTNQNVRFCSYCNNYIYKVDNLTVLQQLKNENKIIAISPILIENLKGKIDNTGYENLFYRNAVIMLILKFKKDNRDIFEELSKINLSENELLKRIIFNIFDCSYNENIVNDYKNKGIDLEFIFDKLILKTENKEFNNYLK